jgi:hypothetical protein
MKLIKTATFTCTFLLALGAFAQAGRMPQGGMQSPNQPGMAQPGQQSGQPTTGQSTQAPADAQPSQQPAPSTQSQQASSGQPSIDDQVRSLSTQLNLTSDQQTKVKTALEDQHTQAMNIVQDNSLQREDKIQKIHALRETTITKVRTALNGDQQKKFDVMVQQMEQREHDQQQASPQSPK